MLASTCGEVAHLLRPSTSMKTSLSNAGGAGDSGAGLYPPRNGFNGRNPYKKLAVPTSVSSTTPESVIGPDRAVWAILVEQCGAVLLLDRPRSLAAGLSARGPPRSLEIFGRGPQARPPRRGKTLPGLWTSFPPHLNSFSESPSPPQPLTG